MNMRVHCTPGCTDTLSLPIPPAPPFWTSGPVVPPVPVLNIICPVIPTTTVASTTVPARITVNGTLFTATTQGTFDGTPMPSTVVSAGQLWFEINSSAYALGPHTIGVTDGGVIGATTCPFEITSALILPTIVSVTPDYIGRQGPVKTITVVGTNFVAAPDPGASQVIYNVAGILPTTFVSATQLTAVMDPAVVQVGGHQIYVANGPLTNRSPTFVVCNCVHNPELGVLDPSSAPSGGAAAVPVRVIGGNFGDTAKVLVDGVEVTTTRISGGTLDITLPASATPVVRQISARLGHDHPPPHGHDNVTVIGPPTSLPFTFT